MSLSATTDLPNEIDELRPLIEQDLDRYTQFDEGCPSNLREAIRYCLLAPGKRIRPALVLLAAKICGGQIQNAMPSACAVEMIHNYSLIHDDLPAMDDDDVRRGRPTCHVQFDEATAILAGDALIPLAFEVIAKHTQPANIAAECVAALAHAAGATALVGGQADDLGLQFTESDIEVLEKIHHRKTGALLSVSLELGAITAGASTVFRQSLKNYGKHLGLAFQITDDLLDLRGLQAKMGKRGGKDIERGKLTYPGVLGELASERRAVEMTEAAIASLEPFGAAAAPLVQLAQFVLNRTY